MARKTAWKTANKDGNRNSKKIGREGQEVRQHEKGTNDCKKDNEKDRKNLLQEKYHQIKRERRNKEQARQQQRYNKDSKKDNSKDKKKDR